VTIKTAVKTAVDNSTTVSPHRLRCRTKDREEVKEMEYRHEVEDGVRGGGRRLKPRCGVVLTR
jgi:hypothetical protein